MKIVLEPTNKNPKEGESFPRIELELQADLLDLDTCLIELVYPALHCIGYDTSELEKSLTVNDPSVRRPWSLRQWSR